jgi:integrase
VVEAQRLARENRTTRVRAKHRLSAVRVAIVKEPGLYEDGGGLRLILTDKGVKRWALRLTIRGRRVERGLGLWPTVSLEEARRKADQFRRAAKEGRDARLEEKHESRRQTVRFRDAFDAFFEVRRQQLSNGKHVQQWQNTMRDYVFPILGNRPVDLITAAEVIEVLKPIWFSKPETAARVLQRIKATFDSAILRGTREKANPCIGITRELGTDHRKVVHHRALAWEAVPAFVRSLRSREMRPVTRLLLEFLILTAARSGEARGALWNEIDLIARTWTIPASDPISGRRMKAGVMHVVPLADRAVEILQEARKLHEGQLVFPGNKGQPLSDNTLSKLMRDGGVLGTPHGFRSAFKDWAAEIGVRDEVSEAALAHADRDKVRAAYRRTRYLDERRMLMRRWAEFLIGSELHTH